MFSYAHDYKLCIIFLIMGHWLCSIHTLSYKGKEIYLVPSLTSHIVGTKYVLNGWGELSNLNEIKTIHLLVPLKRCVLLKRKGKFVWALYLNLIRKKLEENISVITVMACKGRTVISIEVYSHCLFKGKVLFLKYSTEITCVFRGTYLWRNRWV